METKEKKIEYLIFETWNSLKSHLPYIHKSVKNIRYVKGGKRMTDVGFEKECIREYATMIKLLSELL